MPRRQCPFCGTSVSETATQCHHCREALQPVPKTVGPGFEGGRQQIRRGLISMLLAAITHYFAGGYPPVEVPVRFVPIITDWLSPFLFLAGLGLVILGLYRRYTA